jgi:hypothetical protein
LGVTPKDYRADSSRKWRAGISPSSNIILYSDTYSRAIDAEADAVPRIWWIDGTSGTYTDKITELVSRLPERSSVNYALLADYTEAITWLKASGKYALINCDYPEYLFAESFTGCQTIANIESGYLGSYYGGGDTETFNLANPTASVGFGTHATKAFKVKDFNLISGAQGTQPNGNGLGLEEGFKPGTGGIVQTTSSAASDYANGFVFEGIFGGLQVSRTLFELWDTVSNRSIYQVRISSNGKLEVRDSGGSLAYELATNMGLDQPSTYIIFSHAPGSAPTVQVGGDGQQQMGTIGTPITWTNATKWVIGAHLASGPGSTTFGEQVFAVKAFKIHLASSTVTAAELSANLHNNNWTIVSNMYTV